MNDFTFLLFTTQKYSSFNPPYFPKRTLKFFLNSIPACSVKFDKIIIHYIILDSRYLPLKWIRMHFHSACTWWNADVINWFPSEINWVFDNLFCHFFHLYNIMLLRFTKKWLKAFIPSFFSYLMFAKVHVVQYI